jgi:hypothetical protein
LEFRWKVSNTRTIALGSMHACAMKKGEHQRRRKELKQEDQEQEQQQQQASNQPKQPRHNGAITPAERST